MPDNAREIFVKNLRFLMEARGITQADICRELNVSSATASDWCTGKKYPRVDAMQRLADLLGVQLVHGAGQRVPAGECLRDATGGDGVGRGIVRTPQRNGVVRRDDLERALSLAVPIVRLVEDERFDDRRRIDDRRHPVTDGLVLEQ